MIQIDLRWVGISLNVIKSIRLDNTLLLGL